MTLTEELQQDYNNAVKNVVNLGTVARSLNWVQAQILGSRASSGRALNVSDRRYTVPHGSGRQVNHIEGTSAVSDAFTGDDFSDPPGEEACALTGLRLPAVLLTMRGFASTHDALQF
eukprot:3557569-Amphidinium_carterae.2